MNGKIKQSYEEIARATGFRLDPEGGAMYGERSGYDVTMYAPDGRYPYMLAVTVSAQRAGGPLSKEECKQFKSENKPVSQLAQKGALITMSLKNSSQSKLCEGLGETIDRLISFLRANGFQSCCQACGSGTPATCYVSGGYMHLCPDCFTKVQHSTSMDYTQNQQKSENIVGGIVGALLGSLLGVVSIIVFSQLGYVAALSGVIMAICTLKGYELLGGKLTTKGIVISVVLMLLMTFIGDQLDWAILINRELDVDFITAFRIFPELIEQDMIDKGAYIGNLVLQYLFVLLGAIPTIINTLNSRKKEGRIYRLGDTAQAQRFDYDRM